MSVKWMSMLLILVLLGSVRAETVDVNGDFEKCGMNRQGIIMPEGWCSDRSVTKQSEIRSSKEPGTVRNGRFSLLVENEPKGAALVMKYPAVDAKTGDRLQFTCWTKGKGRMALGYICNSNENKIRFLGTRASFKPVASEEDWVQMKTDYTLKTWNKYNVSHDVFKIVPIIYILDECELYIDDYTFDLLASPQKSEK